MPNVAQLLQSKYLSRGDVETAPLTVTISGLAQEQFGGNNRGEAGSRWVMYFQEHRKGLKLNNTNIKLLAAAFGDNTDSWIGKRIRLFLDPTVMMAGQVVGGIRIQTPRSAQPPPSAFSAAAWPQGGPPAAAGPPGGGYPPPQQAAPPSGAPAQFYGGQAPPQQQPPPGAHPAAPPADPDFDDEVPF